MSYRISVESTDGSVKESWEVDELTTQQLGELQAMSGERDRGDDSPDLADQGTDMNEWQQERLDNAADALAERLERMATDLRRTGAEDVDGFIYGLRLFGLNLGHVQSDYAELTNDLLRLQLMAGRKETK